MLSQYPKLQESAQLIGDAKLTELVASLETLLGTEDGTKTDHILSLFSEASSAVSTSDKTTRFVRKTGNRTVRAWKPTAINFNSVLAYSKNLYPFVNDEGDAIIDSIFERVIELVQ